MKLFLLSVCFGLKLLLCNSEVCLNTWTPIPNWSTSDGYYMSSATTLQDCMILCERLTACAAIDFDQRLSQPYCWLFHDNDLIAENSKITINVTQYVVNRTCTSDPEEECQIDWQENSNSKSPNGSQVNYWTEYDCFTYCLYTDGCTVADFDNTTSPPCWVHTDSAIVSQTSLGAVQYRINKTCPSTRPSSTSIGRCAGQWFPNTSFCPPDMKIQIVDAYLVYNPLCCKRNADDAHPPGASKLLAIQVRYLEPSYYQEILSCSGNTTCYIRAETQDNIDCPDPATLGTNFVSIDYQCINSSDTVVVKGPPVSPAVSRRTLKPTPTVRSTDIRNDTPSTVSTVTVRLTDTQNDTPSTFSTVTSGRRSTPGYSAVSSWGATTDSTAASVRRGTLSAVTASRRSTNTQDVANEAMNQSSNNNNNNNRDLIIGLVVGLCLGVPTLLAIIAIIVVFFRRYRKQEKEKQFLDAHPVGHYFYHGSTAHRGAHPENQVNEISMANDII